MRLILILAALLIVGLFAAQALRGPATPPAATQQAEGAPPQPPKVPQRPQDVKQFEKDMNRFTQDAAADQMRRIDEGSR